jgi:uncharacterized protein YfaT (DUF1175 family)
MAYLFIALSFIMSAWGSELILSEVQEASFRGWFTRIVWEQFHYQPNKRWGHRDCAGLVRFALKESFLSHDTAWKKNNSVSAMLTPPEIQLTDTQKKGLPEWRYERAIQLIQKQTRFISKDLNQAKAGDLLFYDFGETQHLMIWMGSYLAYHNGSPSKNDSGLRKQSLNTLMTWKDTRWRPLEQNPNFIGVFRFSFLH